MDIVQPAYMKSKFGLDIYYEHYPNKGKKTLILIHGLFSSTFSYRKLIPLLKQDFNLIAIDLPPFGQSEKSNTFIYSYRNMGKIIIELAGYLQIQHAILVGHSMGGQIALYAASERPDLFEKAVLLCSSGYLNKSKRSLVYSTYIPYFYLYLKRKLLKQGIMKNLTAVVHDHSIIDQEMVDGYLKPFSNDQIFRGIFRLIRHREGDLTSDILKKMETPVLLIWGEEDRIVPIHIGERLHKDLPNSTLHALKKTGHLIPEENPVFVSDQIGHFSLS
ncbi:alpha/beta fold hydrolase [Bacillus pumilus]|uniref:Alpha/beta hydrolase n=1 Tax=Bacillus pumilus TaxID=1408 RepID=A0AAD0MM24_BACPU|nr:alpha/beta hydrolase [Bacillus pumilus]AVM25214.1 alpha/beta hydrolase [Bacillus pumilus]TYS30867.1 alpha/beta hydrolase [Bacillus pumilus]TYS40906.1 alpha/beta hydrolase [Bacillus pumilus]TYS45209.1 alpha/beta hydrolase [Bacillus pumilus]